MGNNDLFAIYVHHGGKFVNVDNHDMYIGGECDGTFDLDPDKFGYFDAADLVEKLGYARWSKLWYQIPRIHSYRVLKSDKEVMVMLGNLAPTIRVLHLYVDGGIIGGDESVITGKEPNVVNEAVATEKEVVSESLSKGLGSVHTEKDVGSGSGSETVNKGEKITGNDDFFEWDFDKYDEFIENFVIDEGEEQGQCDMDGDEGALSESDEDSDYNPCEGESSDDDLDDTELASDDEEYVESRQKVNEGENVFDLIDKDQRIGLGFRQCNVPFENESSEYQSSDGDVCSDSTDEELEGKREKRFKSSYDPRSDPKTLELKLGMRFENGFECRKALRDNAIANDMYIKFSKVSKIKCSAICRPPCEWKIYGSLVQEDDIFIIKTYYPKHTCTRKNNNKLVSSNWIAEKYLNVFRVHPNLPIKHLEEDIRRRFRTIVGKHRLYRARSLAQGIIRGSVEDHYGLLRRYVAELMRVDREGKYLLLLGEGAVFKGSYIGHSALRHGFKKSCRPIIGLDGCFLKTYLGGILLCAVGKIMLPHRICPVIMKKLEKLRDQSVEAYVFPNLNKKFEVHLHGQNFVVDLVSKTCVCRRWDLTGIPCVHACAAIHFQCEEPSTYVRDYYTVERYLQAYKYAIEPLVSEQMWPEAEGYKVKPPPIRKLPGRPKKVRRRAPEEDPKNPNKLKRSGLKMTCRNCQQKGHNSKTCSNEHVPKPPKEKRGRPRKYPSQGQQKKGKKVVASTSTSRSKNTGIGREKRSVYKGAIPGASSYGVKEKPSTQESRNC